MFTKLRNIVQNKRNAQLKNDTSVSKTNRVSELSSFDECIEACDAQASSATNTITDCSVLVSPDGNLLFVPTSLGNAYRDGNEVGEELFKEEEYDSAVRVGCDVNGGDYVQNGFTTKGLGPVRTGEVLDKSTRALTVTARFCEQLLLAEKEGRAHTTSACDRLRNAMTSTGSRKKEKDGCGMGPLFHPGSSLHRALLELECYHTICCEEELVRYWKESRLDHGLEEGVGILPRIQSAAVKSHTRATARRSQIQHAIQTVEEAERLLQRRKEEFEDSRDKVEDTKKAAKARWLELKKERIYEMEVQKLEKNVGEVEFGEGEKENLWEMIHAVAEQHLDFEPSTATATATATAVSKENEKEGEVEVGDILPPLPTLAELEEDKHLPHYKNQALTAENAVEDASASLLNALSSLDTTYRSSRISAESCFLSSANAQKQCLQSLVQMERESLEQRLTHLQKVELVVDQLDVRKDLDLCLGGVGVEEYSEEDGGIASCMAVINCYSIERNTRSQQERKEEGPIHVVSNDASLLEGWGEGETPEEEHEDDLMTPAQIQDLTDNFFQQVGSDELQQTVHSLKQAVQSPSLKIARAHKAGICHALNLKRSTQTQLSTPSIHALGDVLNAVLATSDCSHMEDVSNAKTCMMMAQTFYKEGEDKERNSRVYLKSCLVPHALWENENFWDQALFQLVSESLTLSGVMESFSTAENGSSTSTTLKWHDLTTRQRMEAASQLHALVFSQLGALAHSMREFGCSVDMTCIFVRRMAIRHQLPISQRMVLLNHILASDGEQGGGIDNTHKSPKQDNPNKTNVTIDDHEESNNEISSIEEDDSKEGSFSLGDEEQSRTGDSSQEESITSDDEQQSQTEEITNDAHHMSISNEERDGYDQKDLSLGGLKDSEMEEI